MKAVAFALVCAACTDPVVQMDVKVAPVDNVDLSCVRGLYAWTDGKTVINGSTSDDTVGCVPVSGLTSLNDVPGLIRDKLSLDIPPSGLVGVEVTGITGTCDAPGIDVFWGGSKYIGQDTLTVTLAPQVSCAHENLVVRPVDLFALTMDPNHACPAPIPDGPNTGMDYGLFEQTLFGSPFFYSGASYAQASGVVAVSDFTPVDNPRACLAGAFAQLDGALSGAGCLRFSQNTVCAQPGEIELPTINTHVTGNLYAAAPDARFGNFVVGSVWGIDAAGKKAPLVGATVTVDPTKGRVVYADLANVSSSPTLDLAATAVKSSGLFVLYTNDLTDIQVSAPGFVSETVRVTPDVGTMGGIPDAAVLVTLKQQ
jgi:hypothetical protein